MISLRNTALIALLIYATQASAAGSFRLANGKLIQTGETKAEVIALAGKPIDRDVGTGARGYGKYRSRVRKEILTYRLEGSIGGKYLVVVTIEAGKVTRVTSRQLDRL